MPAASASFMTEPKHTNAVVVWMDHENNDISAEEFRTVEEAKEAMRLDEEEGDCRKAILVHTIHQCPGAHMLNVEYDT